MKTLNDLTSPSKVTRKLLERDVQKQCVDWARARGYWARKFSSMTQNSVPDYLFSRNMADVTKKFTPVHLAVEFKRPGNTSTEAQREEQDAMRAAGWFVAECDNFESFKQFVIMIEEYIQ